MRRLALPLLLAASAAGCAESRGSSTPAAALPPEVALGLGVYVARCEGCHGTDADGTPAGPPLLRAPAGSAWEATVLRSLRDGVPPTAGSIWTVRGMPPVPMAPEDAARLVAYLRWLAAGAPSLTP